MEYNENTNQNKEVSLLIHRHKEELTDRRAVSTFKDVILFFVMESIRHAVNIFLWLNKQG
jgi:hypothetical protein